MKKLIASCLILCCIMSMMAGCADSSQGNRVTEGEEIKVIFIPKITGNAFFEAANEGAQEYAAMHGFSVEYRGSPESDVQNQIEIIEEAIQEEVDAICVSSLDATALDDVLKKAMKAGIQVTTWDSDVTGDARSVMVSQGTPNQLGRMLVEMGAKSLISRELDPTSDVVYYAWHYSRASVTDQTSWWEAGERYIREAYPSWVNVAEESFYSEQNFERAVSVGESILKEFPDIDLIICNDSTALPGQAQAAQNLGLNKDDVTITGFASPNAMREYCKAGILERWGLWDCQVQGALGCYLAYYLAAGNKISVGTKINVPQIGVVEVMPNSVLSVDAYTSNDSGVVLMPSRSEYTADNVDQFDF